MKNVHTIKPRLCASAPQFKCNSGDCRRQTTGDLVTLKLCSGYGQWHSPNNTYNPQPYITTSLAQIRAMIDNPPSMDKSQAQWVIFSKLASRVHEEQGKHGLFVAIWADIDDNMAIDFDAVSLRLRVLLNSAGFIAYTTRSATVENQKLRIIVPMTSAVTGPNFVLLQKILNDKLQKAGIRPDRTTERAGQVCFLPNKGEIWKYQVKDGALDPDLWSNELANEIESEKAAQRVRKKSLKKSREQASQRMASGNQSPIEAFNASHSLELMLESCGYTRYGKRWLSPNSESGVAGVTVNDAGNKWFSVHTSDSQIGKKTKIGTMGDAFDLFVFYLHRGDQDAALKGDNADAYFKR